jgi:hypothetical protein
MPASQPRRAPNLSRRGFLRGAGVALSLPWLASWPARGLAAATAAAPRRCAFLYFPNGAPMKHWVPEAGRSDFTLPFALEPLAPIRERVLVISGLDKKHSRQGDGHYAKTANFLTGMPVAKTTGAELSSGGVSVDQLIAQSLRGQTPLPSLELSTEPVVSGVDSNVGFTRLYGGHISWESANRPVARETNPRLVWERLFGGGGPADPRRRQLQGNLLDHVLADARDVRSKLSRDDRHKMEEFLDAVRAVEQRLDHAAAGDRLPPDPAALGATAPAGVPADPAAHVALMLDMLELAFRTDSTRVATFMFANDVSGRNFSFLDGVSGGHHELSHHEGKDEKIEQYKRITRWHVEQFAGLVGRLAAIPEGEGSLLDSTLLLCGSSMSDGNAHDPDNLPILLAGGGGGTVSGGRHLACKGEQPLCDLHLAIAQRMGVAIESFGDSTGPLPGLDAAVPPPLVSPPPAG